jgi:hypothetical protein
MRGSSGSQSFSSSSSSRGVWEDGVRGSRGLTAKRSQIIAQGFSPGSSRPQTCALKGRPMLKPWATICYRFAVKEE